MQELSEGSRVPGGGYLQAESLRGAHPDPSSSLTHTESPGEGGIIDELPYRPYN